MGDWTAISEKGGGIDAEWMEDILDCVRHYISDRFCFLRNCVGNGSDDEYDI